VRLTCPRYLVQLISGQYPVATTINQIKQNSNLSSSYPAIAYPGKRVTFPLWLNQYNSWTSGITVQNLDTLPQSVHIIFYDPEGTYVIEYQSPNLASNQNYMFIGLPSSSFQGSAVLWSAGPIVAVENHIVPGTVADQFASQSGIHR
jgi:hypothetical protein